ncbi:MAG: FtsX-like permease family protein, partial [Acidobacteriota bacterium]
KVRTLGESPRPVLYLTFEQNRWRRPGHGGEITTGTETLVARVTGDPAPTLAAIRRLGGELDADVAISRLGPLRDAMAPAIAPARAAAGLFTGFGLLGLLLASLGLYAVMADATARRTREIGIRMSLGARPGDILSLVLRDGAAMTGVGLVLGWAVAWFAGRVLEAFLYGIRATDGVAWVGVSVGLAVVALVACWLPARRAVATDPQVALRQE